MKLSETMKNFEFEGPWNHDGYLVPEDVDKKVDEWADKVAELEQENERLQSQLVTQMKDTRAIWLERAVEIEYITPALGNPTHGYTCGYNDGWYAYQKAIRAKIEK